MGIFVPSFEAKNTCFVSYFDESNATFVSSHTVVWPLARSWRRAWCRPRDTRSSSMKSSASLNFPEIAVTEPMPGSLISPAAVPSRLKSATRFTASCM